MIDVSPVLESGVRRQAEEESHDVSVEVAGGAARREVVADGLGHDGQSALQLGEVDDACGG
jgi:hypothetical protein